MNLFKTRQALPLAFHVDYWDNEQWKDPFSIAQADQRQRQYTLYYHSASLFTPEMTVDGGLGFNGADLFQAQGAFSQSASLNRLPPMKLKVSGDSQFLQAQVSLPPHTQTLGNPTLNVVVFENDLSTPVTGGENSGLLLRENFVVRYDDSILRSSVDSPSTWNLRIPLNVSWNLSHIGIAVWLQDLRTMRSEGLNWIYPLYSRKPIQD